MNLLEDAWIPVRADGGMGAFRLLTYRELLCEPGNWQVSLPRDDLESGMHPTAGMHDSGHVPTGKRSSLASPADRTSSTGSLRCGCGALQGLV